MHCYSDLKIVLHQLGVFIQFSLIQFFLPKFMHGHDEYTFEHYAQLLQLFSRHLTHYVRFRSTRR